MRNPEKIYPPELTEAQLTRHELIIEDWRRNIYRPKEPENLQNIDSGPSSKKIFFSAETIEQFNPDFKRTPPEVMSLKDTTSPRKEYLGIGEIPNKIIENTSALKENHDNSQKLTHEKLKKDDNNCTIS